MLSFHHQEKGLPSNVSFHKKKGYQVTREDQNRPQYTQKIDNKQNKVLLGKLLERTCARQMLVQGKCDWRTNHNKYINVYIS